MTTNQCTLLETGKNNVLTAAGTLYFPNLAKPKEQKKGDARYKSGIVFDKDADLSILTDLMVSACDEAFGKEHIPSKLKTKIKTLKGTVTKMVFDDESKNYSLVQPEGRLHGLRTFECTSAEMPTLVTSPNNERVFPEDASESDRASLIKKAMYGGCRVQFMISVYAGSFEDEKGTTIRFCSLQLKGVRKVGEGEPLGAAPLAVDEMFPDMSADDAAGGDAWGGDEEGDEDL